MKNLNKTGVTLLEILLASVIFVVSIAGIFATLNAVRTPVTTKENALMAAVFGKQVLDTLRSVVNAGGTTYYGICAGNCATFDLQLGPHQVVAATLAAYGITWPSADLINANKIGGVTTLSYTVSCADGSVPASCNADVARRLDLNINY